MKNEESKEQGNGTLGNSFKEFVLNCSHTTKKGEEVTKFVKKIKD